MIPVLFVVTILVFSIIRFIPGEPARLILGEKATEEADIISALTGTRSYKDAFSKEKTVSILKDISKK